MIISYFNFLTLEYFFNLEKIDATVKTFKWQQKELQQSIPLLSKEDRLLGHVFSISDGDYKKRENLKFTHFANCPTWQKKLKTFSLPFVHSPRKRERCSFPRVQNPSR